LRVFACVCVFVCVFFSDQKTKLLFVAFTILN